MNILCVAICKGVAGCALLLEFFFYLILTVISQSCHLRNVSAELESGVYNTVKLK